VRAAEIELGLVFSFGSPGWGITALTNLSLIAMAWWRRRPLAALVVLAGMGIIGATAPNLASSSTFPESTGFVGRRAIAEPT